MVRYLPILPRFRRMSLNLLTLFVDFIRLVF